MELVYKASVVFVEWNISFTHYYIGLHKVDGNWQWTDGTPLDYVNFLNGVIFLLC